MQSGLPVGVAAFVGRGRERAKVADLVADARVVTLTGPGGCGKTRLAVEVVGDVASRFSDGACWVDLQGVSEPGLVAPAIGGAVDVHERPEQALTDTLAEQLHARHLLVVLDNCEHLVEACAELVGGLSSACPQLHVLATSRVPLVVEGEATFEVAGLPVPDPDAGSASTVAAADAARLFEVRARQVAADFRIGDDNASAVAEICRRLDGIPLAIELAAARVRVLAPGQIAAGLSDRFGLLTGGVRGAPARQRTLEASLDWSYDLLDDVQRLALARLSVFAGSFELDAAEEVVGGEGIDRDDVLDLVAGLVEQSLLQVAQRQGRARYRLLETIRVYARQRLSELDDPDRVRGRHLEFHVGLAGRAQEGLHGGQPEPWVARLAADLDDLRAAMDWAAETGDLRGLVGITEPIVRFWFELGLSREVHRRLHDAAEVPGAPDDERVRGLITAAALALAMSPPASIGRRARRSLRRAPLMWAVRSRSRWANEPCRGFFLGCRPASRWTLTSSRRSNSRSGARMLRPTPTSWRSLGQHSFTAARSTPGAACSSRPWRCARPTTSPSSCRPPTRTLGCGRCGPGGSTRHADTLDVAVELSRQVGRPGWEAIGLTGLAAAAVLQGDHDRAQDWLSEAQAALRHTSPRGDPLRDVVASLAGVVGLRIRRTGAARATAEEIVRIGRGGGSRLDEAIGEWLLGMVARSQKRHDDARAHLEASRALSTDPRLPHDAGSVVARPRGTGQGGRGPRRGVGAGP